MPAAAGWTACSPAGLCCQSKCHRCVTDAADREVERLAAVKEKSAAERAGAAGVEAPPAVVGVLADAAALGLLECCDADS